MSTKKAKTYQLLVTTVVTFCIPLSMAFFPAIANSSMSSMTSEPTPISTIIETQSIETLTEILQTQSEANIVETTPVSSQETSSTPLLKYTLTAEERTMLASLCYLEGRGESYECQKMILSVVFNRYDSKQWGNTFKEVVYAEGQFTPASRITNTTPNQTQYEVVDEICKDGVSIPSYVLYFRANYYFKWSNHLAYKNLDNTYFSYNVSDRQKVEPNFKAPTKKVAESKPTEPVVSKEPIPQSIGKSYKQWTEGNTYSMTCFAYCDKEPGGGGGAYSASGKKLVEGMVANGGLPFGTVIEFEGKQYTVEDRGVNSQTIDIYFDTVAEMNAYGKHRNVQVKIVKLP